MRLFTRFTDNAKRADSLQALPAAVPRVLALAGIGVIFALSVGAVSGCASSSERGATGATSSSTRTSAPGSTVGPDSSSTSGASIVKGAGRTVTLQVTLSGAIQGQLSDLRAGPDFSCGPEPAVADSPFVFGEVDGSVGGVRYRFSVSTDVYQGLGQQPDANAYLGRLNQSPSSDYFEAGVGTTDILTMTSPTAGRFSIDLTAPNTGFAVSEHVAGQFQC